ncbi:MAG: GTPase HflX [Ignavibacteriales bacterium]|nr:GTPase HflX [Ignavibacteriales bacterium]
MIENSLETRERAIVVAVQTPLLSDDDVDEHLTELEELAKTAGADSVARAVQDRRSIDSATYVGKGKAEQIKTIAEAMEATTIIFDDDLSPAQTRNLENAIERKIVDRSSLILDIFAKNARTRAAKTQVELAQLEYLLPRLTRMWTHLSKQYGGVGTKGPGETQIETDRRIVRDRIAKLKKKLAKIETTRETQAANRSGAFNACLVGYTNAGKSTLFNRLADAGALQADKLFATLDSTTRELDAKHLGADVLLSDTVGFIRKLPARLVESFKSTLNEARDADLIIHVVDVSHEYFEDHVRVVEETLKELGAEETPRVVALNKIDLLKDRDRLHYALNRFPDATPLSAARGYGVEKLWERIRDRVEATLVSAEVRLPIHQTKAVADVHRMADVLSTDYGDEIVTIRYRADRKNAGALERILADAAR